ncbi:hypothetical protein ES703_84778 [subsurface metagenome]
MQLAASQCRLKDIGGVDRPLCRTGAYDGVKLVYKEDNVLTRNYLLEYTLKPFLELTAVLGTRNYRSHVNGKYPCLTLRHRDLASHDFLCQAFNDSGFAYPGLADEGRVVLLTPGEDLDNTLDLLFPADYWIKLSFFGKSGKVARKVIE